MSIGLAVAIVLPSISFASYNGVASIPKSDVPSWEDTVCIVDITATGTGINPADPIPAAGLITGHEYYIMRWGAGGFCGQTYTILHNNANGNEIYVYVSGGLFYTTMPAPLAPAATFSIFATSSGISVGDLQPIVWWVIAGMFGIFILVIGLNLAVYLIRSVVDLFKIHTYGAGSVKKITSFTSWLNRQSPAARATRRAWKKDMENNP